MTKLHIENGSLIVEVMGADKLWALKSHLTIPLEHIVLAEYKPEVARVWYHGLKLPGSSIPGVLTAGTFYKDGQRVFWDVHHADKTIVLTLRDESYQQLVIEVADPQQAIKEVMAAL
jgi:hypothetical protein